MISRILTLTVIAFFFASCASTDILESPKTAFVPENSGPEQPDIIWTSRTLGKSYDYLGQVTVKSWTYDGALGRLKSAGKELRADALIDVHYQPVGFMTQMHAFAIKYRQ